MVSASFLFVVIILMSVASCSLSAARGIEVRHDFEALEPSPPIFRKELLDATPSVAQKKDIGRVISGRKTKMEKMVVYEKETMSRRSTNAAPKLDMAFTSDYHVPKPHPPKNN